MGRTDGRVQRLPSAVLSLLGVSLKWTDYQTKRNISHRAFIMVNPEEKTPSGFDSKRSD